MSAREDLRDRLYGCINSCSIDAGELADAIFGAVITTLQPILGRSQIELELLLGDLRRAIEHRIETAADGMVDVDPVLDSVIDELLGERS